MLPIRVAKFSPRKGSIVVPGAREFSLLYGDDERLHGLIDDFSDVSLTSLARAANAFRASIAEKRIWMRFYDLAPESFEPSVSPREPFEFEFFGDRMRIRAAYDADTDDPAPWPDFLRVMGRFLAQHKARVMRTEHQDDFGRVLHLVDFEFLSLRSHRVSDARALANGVRHLASAVALKGALDASAVEAIIRSGEPHLLIGQHEHQSFEAKSSAYDLATRENQYEIAKDVAAFANGSQGGLIVCGLRTKRVRGSDIVIDVTPVDLSRLKPRDWMNRVRDYVVPVPEGLHIEAVSGGSSRGFMLVRIPRQPET